MKAWEPGDRAMLIQVGRPDEPVLVLAAGPGDVLVRIESIGLNMAVEPDELYQGSDRPAPS